MRISDAWLGSAVRLHGKAPHRQRYRTPGQLTDRLSGTRDESRALWRSVAQARGLELGDIPLTVIRPDARKVPSFGLGHLARRARRPAALVYALGSSRGDRERTR